jgi:hypothetical protein
LAGDFGQVRDDHGLGGQAHARWVRGDRGGEPPGGKGASREDIVRDFVARYLPRSAEATGRGEIITADGQVSPECDVMIVDRSTPPLMDSRDFRIVPAECSTAW